MMKQTWRDLLEIAAVVSVVGGLLLVAYEIRQSNRIARAQVVIDLTTSYNEFNTARFTDPGVAQLGLHVREPDRFEISELENSRMLGLAYHLHNIVWSAQTAYDNGLLSAEGLENYRNDLSGTFELMPGLTPHLIEIFRTQPGKKDAYVFEPLAELEAEWSAQRSEE